MRSRPRLSRRALGLLLPLGAAVAALAVSTSLLVAGPAEAQWGRGSLFTETGVEISVDARVISLYAMLNALGYDHETEFGAHPLLRPKFTDAREKARSSLGRSGPGLSRMQAIVGKLEWPAYLYHEAALELGDAPGFEPAGKPSKLTSALYTPIRTWFNEEGGIGVFQQVTSLSSGEQKKLSDLVGAGTKKLRDAVRLGDDEDQLLDDTGPKGRVILSYNPLDAHGTLRRTQIGDLTYIVAGPFANDAQRTAAVNATLVAYARTLVSRDTEKVAKAAQGIPAKRFGELGKAAKKDLANAGGFASELLACATTQAVVKGATCVASPLSDEKAAAEALALVEPRVKAWLDDGRLLHEAVEELLAAEAPPPPAPEPAPAPAPGPAAAATPSPAKQPAKPAQ